MAAAQSPDPRARFRGDSIKVTGREAHVYKNWTPTSGYNRRSDAVSVSATLLLENLSGVGLDAAIRTGSASLGGCSTYPHLTGLAWASDQGKAPNSVLGQPTPKPALKYLPANSRTIINVDFGDCSERMFQNMKAVDFVASLVLSINKEIFDIPISAATIPLRNSAN